MLKDIPAVTFESNPLLSVSVGISKVYCHAGTTSLWSDIINGAETPVIMVREDLEQTIFLLPTVYEKILTEFLFCADDPEGVISVLSKDGVQSRRLFIGIRSDANKPKSETAHLLFSLPTKVMLLSNESLQGISQSHRQSLFYTSDGAPILGINARCDDSVDSFEPDTSEMLKGARRVARSPAGPIIARLCLLLETFDAVRDKHGKLPDFLLDAGVDDVANEITKTLAEFKSNDSDEFPEHKLKVLDQRLTDLLTNIKDNHLFPIAPMLTGGFKR